MREIPSRIDVTPARQKGADDKLTVLERQIAKRKPGPL